MIKKELLETIQKMVVRLVAINPAGHNLCLIGGFRYRFLDSSARMSTDIDYHWSEDLDKKQAELIALFRRRLAPEVKRRFGYEADVRAATGPDTESPILRVIELAFWQPEVVDSRIEIPVEITRIICLDKMTVRTADGVVYLTPSDSDMIESKIIAIFNRLHLEYRDIVDVFLFSNQLASDSAQRIKVKFAKLSVDNSAIKNRRDDLIRNSAYHVRGIKAVLEAQLDTDAAANIQAGGGAQMVLDKVIEVLDRHLDLTEIIEK
jgi:hypothetical protein